jgi:hypothetical protein
LTSNLRSPKSSENSTNTFPSRFRKLSPTAAALVTLLLFCLISASAQVNVTTYHNDIARTGQNLNETTLTPANVNANSFGLLFRLPVDGYVYGQPLYLASLTIGGQTHNVLFVTTQHDSVYAFDADANTGSNAAPLWHASMLISAHGAAAGATTIPWPLGSDIYPEVGITGTPVIDPSSGTLYLVSASLENGKQIMRLHALDVTSGAEKFGGPTVITASIAGTGNGSVNGRLTFDPVLENQRPGLLLLNGIVYLGFSAHEDLGAWHGWLLAYNAATLKQTGVFCTTPDGVGAGIWMSGFGLAAEVVDPVNHPFGRMFVPTGNGDYTATTPYTSQMDYGQSILNLDLTNGVPTVTDLFTPSNGQQMSGYDGDVASGGLMLIPAQTTGPNPDLLVQADKDGTMFLLNRNDLGGFNSTSDNIVQEIPFAVGETGAWSGPAYWNGNVYWIGQNDNLKSFPLADGQLGNPAVSYEQYGYPGATPSISANGTSQAIVWDIDEENFTTFGPSILRAHNATNVASTLYSSTTNAARDTAGGAVKFAVPTIDNGKVYVGAVGEVDVFGLLSSTQTPAPVMTPGTESYSGAASVSITDASPGAAIYYTLDGSAPTTASSMYATAIPLTKSETVNAIALAPGSYQSAVVSNTYTNTAQTAPPVLNYPTGIYLTPLTVTITGATPGSVIYYTLDGTTPTSSSTRYTTGIAVSYTLTLTAIAIAPGYSASNPTAIQYTIQSGGSGFNFSQGFAGAANLKINGSAAVNGTRLRLVSGGANQAASAWFSAQESVQSAVSAFVFQVTNPQSGGFTFTIQNSAAGTAALGSSGSSLGYAPISPSVALKFDMTNSAGEGSDSIGLYINGQLPTVPAVDLSASAINIRSGHPIAVVVSLDYSGYNVSITDLVTNGNYTATTWIENVAQTISSNNAYFGFTAGTGSIGSTIDILSWTYASTVGTSETQDATPTFSPAGGTYSSPQTVTINDSSVASNGATIFYTTNGATPNGASLVYSGPISVTSSQTIEAIAITEGFQYSNVASATYTIGGSVAAPIINPPAGTYNGPQTVTLTDTTADSTIYYTTNGTPPTTSSTHYIGAFTADASENLQAIAVAPGISSPSSVSNALYSFVASVPVIGPAGGSYSGTQKVTITDATPGAAIYFTANGTAPTTASRLYTGPLTVSTSGTLQAIAAESGYSNSAVASATYIFGTPAATPAFNPPGGIYTSAKSVSISDTTTGASIYYTTNGATPTTSSTLYTGPVTVGSTATLQAIAVAPGYTASSVASSSYTINLATATPTFSVPGGTYGVTGSVTITDATPGAAIYYTTNGLTPTTSSTPYTGPVAVTTSETLKAIALAPGYTLSSVASATYTLSIQVVAPVFSVASGTYNSYQTVSMSTTTPNATIYFTYSSTGGVVPTTASTKYTGPFQIGYPMTIEAIAVAPNLLNSNVTSAVYSYLVATPAISPAGGSFNAPQTVTITSATSTANIYYTTNGLPATTNDQVSKLYSGPFTVSANETVHAIAGQTSWTTSAQAVASFTISPPAAPAFSLSSGSYAGSQSVTISDATPGTTIYYTTNGVAPTASSTLYTGPITVAASETLQAIATLGGNGLSGIGTATYTITPTVATPQFSLAAGTYTTAQTVSITDATKNATIYYTTNGALPTTSSTQYISPLSVSANEIVQAIALSNNGLSSTVASALYTIAPYAQSPRFSTPAGTYSNTLYVALNGPTYPSTIYYTTNGTTPSATNGTLYTSVIPINSTETIEAVAMSPGYTNSSVSSAAYVITATTPASVPALSVPGGVYNSYQTVALTDAAPGATIYYTLNTAGGATPTGASTKYAAPFVVPNNATLEAIAVAPGYLVSPAATATYSYSVATPLLSPSGGTFVGPQTVTTSSATPSASIYYTTNGLPATTNDEVSTLYTGPFTVSASEVVHGIAGLPGWTSSPQVTANYTITEAEVATLPSSYVSKRLGVWGHSLCMPNFETNGTGNTDWQAQVSAILGMSHVFNDCNPGRGFYDMFQNYPGLSLSNMNALSDGSSNTGGKTVGTTIAQDLADVDVMLIWLGDNDFDVEPLGTPSDTAGQRTFYGYVDNALQILLKAKANLQIVFLSQYYAGKSFGLSGYQQIESVLSAKAAQYGATMIPMLELSGIDPSNWAETLNSDQLHPQSAEVAVLANIIANQAAKRQTSPR